MSILSVHNLSHCTVGKSNWPKSVVGVHTVKMAASTAQVLISLRYRLFLALG